MEQARQSAERALELQGENWQLLNRVESLEEQLREANQGRTETYQMLANVYMQEKYSFAPFPQAPRIPDQVHSEIKRGGGVSEFASARSIVRQRTNEALGAILSEVG